MLVGQTGSPHDVEQVVRLPQVALRFAESDPGPSLQGRMRFLGCRREDPRVPLHGVFRSQSRQGVVTGDQRIGPRLGQLCRIAGRRPVMRERGRPFCRDPRALFDGFGYPAMESSSAGRTQPVVKSPLNERMGEGESIVDLRQHSGPECNVEVIDAAVDIHVAGKSHKVGVKISPDDRRRGQGPINLLSEGEGAVAEEVADTHGQLIPTGIAPWPTSGRRAPQR